MPEKTKYFLMASLLISFVIYTLFIYTWPTDHKIAEDSVIVMKGKMIWQKKNCNACHQIYGLGGFLGPDLTNIYSTTGKGPTYIRAFVSAGTSTMPSFQLQEQEMEALLLYLRHIDASGKADPKQFKVSYYGTLEGR